jgi:hypothetical protein
MVKADWLPFWNHPLPDIYIILFSSIKTQLSLTKCLKMSSAKQYKGKELICYISW